MDTKSIELSWCDNFRNAADQIWFHFYKQEQDCICFSFNDEKNSKELSLYCILYTL